MIKRSGSHADRRSCYDQGVVVATLRTLTEPGDTVLVHVPVYTGFIYGIAHAGCRMVGSPLIQDKDGSYRMDLEDMERRIAKEHIKCVIMILSPVLHVHQPGGSCRNKLSAGGHL